MFKEKAPQEKTTESLQSLVEGTPDAFCILAGPSRFHKDLGYLPSSFSIGDENSRLALERGDIDPETLGVDLSEEDIARVKETGVPAGGNDRIMAAAAMHQALPEVSLVTVTKPREQKRGEPTYATIIEMELRRRGVSEDRILSDGEKAKAVDSITEFKRFAELWKEHGWTSIVFITAAWHVPRAEALLNHIEDFADKDNDEEVKLLTEFADAIRSGELTIQFLDSTEILSTVDSRFRRFFEKKLAQDPGMRLRQAMEENAVAQISGGTYGNKKLIHKIWDDQHQS